MKNGIKETRTEMIERLTREQVLLNVKINLIKEYLTKEQIAEAEKRAAVLMQGK